MTDEIIGETRRIPFDRFLTQFNQVDMDEKKAMKTIGIDTKELMKNQCGMGTMKPHHIRGFYALLMYSICKGKHPALVADSFGVERGTIQRFRNDIFDKIQENSDFCSSL